MCAQSANVACNANTFQMSMGKMYVDEKPISTHPNGSAPNRIYERLEWNTIHLGMLQRGNVLFFHKNKMLCYGVEQNTNCEMGKTKSKQEKNSHQVVYSPLDQENDSKANPLTQSIRINSLNWNIQKHRITNSYYTGKQLLLSSCQRIQGLKIELNKTKMLQ